MGLQLYMFDYQSRFKVITDESMSKLSQDKFKLAEENYKLSLSQSKAERESKRVKEELEELRARAQRVEQENEALKNKLLSALEKPCEGKQEPAQPKSLPLPQNKDNNKENKHPVEKKVRLLLRRFLCFLCVTLFFCAH